MSPHPVTGRTEPGYELTEDDRPALAGLSEQERAIVVLRFGHHKTQRQIGTPG